MKILLVSSALAAASVFAPAFAQQASSTTATVESDKSGTVTVQGVEPSKVLGAIQPEKLVDEPSPPTSVEAKTRSNVTVETDVEHTPTATVETRTETIAQVSDRPKLDAETPIAPEVQAVVSSGKKYSTQDIVLAELAAMKKTPISTPTTTITTTTSTPAGG